MFGLQYIFPFLAALKWSGVEDESREAAAGVANAVKHGTRGAYKEYLYQQGILNYCAQGYEIFTAKIHMGGFAVLLAFVLVMMFHGFNDHKNVKFWSKFCAAAENAVTTFHNLNPIAYYLERALRQQHKEELERCADGRELKDTQKKLKDTQKRLQEAQHKINQLERTNAAAMAFAQELQRK
jgi:hypothetical protein